MLVNIFGNSLLWFIYPGRFNEFDDRNAIVCNINVFWQKKKKKTEPASHLMTVIVLPSFT